jgi:glycosyltransferase involved in cell wall biosynthesis
MDEAAKSVTVQPRPKVLMLAFACEPDFGSEPEVGWRWATEMHRYADVTVITDEGHHGAVEEWLNRHPGNQKYPMFHFFGPGPHRSRLFRWFGYRGYYRWWMREVRPFIATLHTENRFDLMHHVTYAGCRYSTAVWNQGAPVIWGPVGGLEPMPFDVIPWNQPKTAIFEVARNVGNHLSRGHLQRGARQSALVLASTRETQDAFARAGVKADLMSTIGIEREILIERAPIIHEGPLRLVFAGRLLALKGLAVAIQAIAQVPEVVFTIIGEGPFGGPARALVEKLDLQSRIEFRPMMKRPDLIKEYGAHDVLVYPSFHDSGGFVVLEAMARGLPVICLDCGGPGIAVRDRCGVRIPLQKRAKIVTALAAAIRRYAADRTLVANEGSNARRSVEENYLWSRKAEKMSGLYEAAMGRAQTAR